MDRKNMSEMVGSFALLLIVGYLGIGLVSLAQVAQGVDGIPYMPFWHAPWKWVLEAITG